MSEKINDGGQAFPMHDRDDELKGMSLRDYVASQALIGMVNQDYASDAHTISLCFNLADEFIKQRNQK